MTRTLSEVERNRAGEQTGWPLSIPKPATRAFCGIPIAAMTMRQVLQLVDEVIGGRGRLQIGVVNAAKVVNMRRNELLREDVLSSDVILADGISVVWACRLLGQPLPERVAGIDLFMEILRAGNARGYRVYCLGASQEVLDLVVARIAADFPGVKLVGAHHGYFGAGEEAEIAAEIEAARPDVLFVAMTSPKKEKFIARWSQQMDVRVCHGVGGSFDVFAGKVERAPQAWQRLGMEWLYRLVQEPRRLLRRYLVTNTLFCLMVLREFFRPERQSGMASHRS